MPYSPPWCSWSGDGSADTAEAKVLPFHGRVIDDRNERPVAEARVVAIQFDGDPVGTAKTSRTGSFVLNKLEAKPSVLRISATGYESHAWSVTPFGDRHATESGAAVIRLRPAAVLTGRVVDERGQPRTDAMVIVRTGGGSSRYVHSHCPGRWTTKPDHDGRFSFDDLWGDVSYRVDLLAPDHTCLLHETPIRIEERFLQIRPGEKRHIEFRWPRGADLEGTVRDQFGHPVAGVNVLVSTRTLSESSFFLFGEAVTDATGRYRLQAVPGGRWLVGNFRQIDRDGTPAIAARWVAVLVSGDESRIIQDIVVQRDLWIEGRVVDPEGRGLEAVYLLADPLGDDNGRHRQAQAHTDRNGHFKIGPLGPGKHKLAAYPIGVVGEERLADSTAVTATAGESGVVIRLRLGGAIEGRVVPSTRTRMQWRLSATSRETGETETGSSDDDARFRLEQLPAGIYDLTVQDSRAGRIGAVQGVRVMAGETTRLPDVDCRTPGGVVRVAIPGVDDFRARKFSIDVLGVDRNKVLSHDLRGVPSEFLVPSGTYRLVLRVDGDERASESIAVRPGETTPVVFDLGR